MMNRFPYIVLVLFLCLSGCSTRESAQRFDTSRYVSPDQEQETLLSRFAPVFHIAGWQRPYNRIGKVTAARTVDAERITVDPSQPVVYVARFPFETENGSYINLVYRIHFPSTPFSLIPFYLTAGGSPGIMVIVTLDKKEQPLLVTTAQTCGCYVAIIPTSHLAKEAYPQNWPLAEQNIYGETLPALLPKFTEESRLLFTVQPATHRVETIALVPVTDILSQGYVTAELKALASLKELELEDGSTTSLYYDNWPLQGHVKGAVKPWEMLLLSLISFDLYVGMDKEYTGQKGAANSFYTSLKVWNRRRSDMNDFPGFLEFYGWKL